MRVKYIAKYLFIASASLSLMACSDKEYGKEIGNALERIYGKEKLSDYEVRALPMTGHGVGHSYYVNKVATKSKGISITDTKNWWELGVTDEVKEDWGKRIISDGSSGSIKLDEELSTNLSLNVLAPLYKKIADLDASVDYKKGVKLKISAKNVMERGLNLAWFNRALAEGYLIKELNNAKTNNDLILVAYDIAFDGYEAEISINTSLNPGLSAKLAELEGALDGIEGSFKLDRTSDGTFKVTSDELVIAAVDLRKIPNSGAQSGIKLNDWERVNSKENTNLYKNLEEVISTHQ